LTRCAGGRHGPQRARIGHARYRAAALEVCTRKRTRRLAATRAR
jgi:hypothetical protein